MYIIGWTGPFNSMDGSAELVGFMRTLKVVDQAGLESACAEFSKQMEADGIRDFSVLAEEEWSITTYSDCAWIAYKEV